MVILTATGKVSGGIMPTLEAWRRSRWATGKLPVSYREATLFPGAGWPEPRAGRPGHYRPPPSDQPEYHYHLVLEFRNKPVGSFLQEPSA